MTTATAWRRMIATEGRLVWRDPAGVFLPLALPLLVIAMHGLSPGGDEPLPGTDGLTAVDAVAMPTGLVIILAILGLVNVPSFLATYRQQGVLRRLAVTPAHPAMVLVAQVVVNLALGGIGIALGIAFAAAAFGLSAPTEPAWAVLSIALVAVALYGVGLLIAAIAPSPNAAIAIGLVAFLGMMAVGGGMLPVESLPEAVARVGQYLPFGAGLQALRDSWVGNTPQTLHLAVTGLTAAVSGALAVKLFRWQ